MLIFIKAGELTQWRIPSCGFKWVWGTLVLCCLGLFSSGLVFVEVLPGLFRKNHIGAAVVSRL